MASPTFYTAEMVRALPDDGNRYETVYGELLVTSAPHPSHQSIVFDLGRTLHDYLTKEAVAGKVFLSPADISWARDVLVQPDVFVVPLAEARALEWSAMQHLMLVIEVLSPSTARADRIVKRRLYQNVGVPLYWVVDAKARHVEIWTPAAESAIIERERLVWHPNIGVAPFVMELEELFRPI